MSLTTTNNSSDSKHASDFFKSLRTDDGKLVIEVRESDGYINATKLAQSGGKLFADYSRLSSTKKFMTSLSMTMGAPIVTLVQQNNGRNGQRHSFVHRRVAIHLANWVSSEFAGKVTDLVDRYVKGEVTSGESQAAAAIVANATNPPSYDSVRYENVPPGPKIYCRQSIDQNK